MATRMARQTEAWHPEAAAKRLAATGSRRSLVQARERAGPPGPPVSGARPPKRNCFQNLRRIFHPQAWRRLQTECGLLLNGQPPVQAAELVS
jgi:hypothetical protein